MIGTYNFEPIVSGCILNKTFRFLNRTDNTPKDLTVYSDIQMKIRRDYDEDPIVDISLGDGITLSGTTNHVMDLVAVQIPDDISGFYIHEIKFIGTGLADVYIRGNIEILKKIT